MRRNHRGSRPPGSSLVPRTWPRGPAPVHRAAPSWTAFLHGDLLPREEASESLEGPLTEASVTAADPALELGATQLLPLVGCGVSPQERLPARPPPEEAASMSVNRTWPRKALRWVGGSGGWGGPGASGRLQPTAVTRELTPPTEAARGPPGRALARAAERTAWVRGVTPLPSPPSRPR